MALRPGQSWERGRLLPSRFGGEEYEGGEEAAFGEEEEQYDQEQQEYEGASLAVLPGFTVRCRWRPGFAPLPSTHLKQSPR